jgi:maltose alpha-D-glucosyltransferase/alpha-amylase
MGDDLALPERWPVRTCMQWTDDETGGFSARPAAGLRYDMVQDADYAPFKVNAAAQQRDPESLFNWLRRLVELRKSCTEVGWGDLSLPETNHLSVLVQRFEWEGQSVLTLHNLSPAECQAQVDGFSAVHKLTDLFGNRVYSSESCEGSMIELDGYGYRWLRIVQ